MEYKETYTDFISIKNKIVDTIIECIIMYGTDEPDIVVTIGGMSTSQFFSESNMSWVMADLSKPGRNKCYENTSVIATIVSALANTKANKEKSLMDYMYDISLSFCEEVNVIQSDSSGLFVANGVLNKNNSKKLSIILSGFAINIFYKDILKGIKNAKNK